MHPQNLVGLHKVVDKAEAVELGEVVHTAEVVGIVLKLPNTIQHEAISIKEVDDKTMKLPSFQPVHEVGPHLPHDWKNPFSPL